MKHEVTIRLVKKQGFFNETLLIDAKNGDQAAVAGEAMASNLFDEDKEIISYSIIGIHPVDGGNHKKNEPEEVAGRRPLSKKAVVKKPKKTLTKKRTKVEKTKEKNHEQ